MKAIYIVFKRLLADVSYLSGFSSIERLAELGLDWALKEAPKLEKDLLRHIETGVPLQEHWPEALQGLSNRFVMGQKPADLRLLRQVLLFCYKAEHRHTDETEANALIAYRECNSAVGVWDSRNNYESNPLTARARTHCTSVLAAGAWDKIVPSHGPGAVADKTSPKGKWTRWYPTIESCYPYGEYMDLGNEMFSDGLAPVITDPIVAKLVSVPKDARGPRLICVHPAESIWIQQGVRRELERCIGRHRDQRFGWIWPRGHIHFDDQTVNGSLSLSSSLDGKYATLDLKEASDRLSDRLVQHLFGRFYRWFGCCRAHYVQIGQEIVPLNCYAPMGNATTFPVQSLVFWAVCVSAMESCGFHQPWDCYVFGDDLVVPSEMAPRVCEALSSFGLVVNREKSFIYGLFRESCGVDAFNGIDVTPIRWKTTYDPFDAAGLQSLSSIAQRLRIQGYDEASIACYDVLRSRLFEGYGKQLYATNNLEHGGIAEYVRNSTGRYVSAYWHKRWQWYYSPVWRLQVAQSEQPHGWYHVLSSLTSLIRTGRSNDPATVPLRHNRLILSWARVQ